MRTSSIVLASIVTLLIAAALAAGGIATATAGKDGCPDGHAATGAAHADPRSAHGADKQAARSCYVAPPTPTPTPTPTPPADGTVLYFSLQFNQTVGGLSTANEDIIAFDGTAMSLYFDGSDVGLDGYTLDAFSRIGPNEALMSFAEAATIPGIAGTVDDSDLVKFTATSLGDNTDGSFSLYFDGSDVGLTVSTEDVDAVELLPDGRVLVSLTDAFSVDGVSGEDEDVIALTQTSLGDTTAGSWAMYFDGSDIGLADSPDEDVDALAVASDGAVYLSVVRAFSVAGLSGSDEDVFACIGPTLGDSTSCASFSMFFDGSAFGLTSNDVTAIDLP